MAWQHCGMAARRAIKMRLLWLGSLAVLAGVILWRRGKDSVRRAESRYPPQGEFVPVGNARLHYVRKGQGQSVVLLHGSDGFQQDFAALFAEERAAEFDLIAIDRPGHGYSDAVQHGGNALAAQAHRLHTALEQLGIERPILVGHSWGAALCLYYAVKYPRHVAGMVLLSPWIYAAADPPMKLLRLASWLGQYVTYALLRVTPLKWWLLRSNLKQAFFPHAVPTDYEREAFALWQRTPAQVETFLRENVEAWRQFPALSPCYAQIGVPVCIIAGLSDKAIHASSHAFALYHALTAAEVEIVQHAGHELPQCHPHLVMAAIIHCHRRGRFQAGERAEFAGAETVPKSGDARHKARELIFRYGWNPTAYQILNSDIRLWFSPDGEAVVGYVTRFKVRVAAGAPICDEARLADVAALFEQDAAEHGERVCWFAATARLQKVFAKTLPHASLTVGAQPAWNPASWQGILKQYSSLRGQLNRARNKGVQVSEWAMQRAADDAGLQRCLDEWIAQHPMPTLHFLTEPVTLDRLADRRIWVAEKSGVPVGFVIATPVPSRNGWLIEQTVRGKNAPNGTAELMIDSAMTGLAKSEASYVTLGMVPLTPRTGTGTVGQFWLRTALTWARLHGRRFYNFEGLEAFKSKFKPETWEPLFALSNEPRSSFRTLMAIVAAFSEGPLPWVAVRALASAARQEAVWLGQRRREKVSQKM